MHNHLDLNIFNCLALTGIIQGVVFAAVVASSEKYRSFGTLILAAFILSFSLDNMQFFLEDAGVVSESLLMETFYVPFQFLSGPLFLLYGLSLIDPLRTWRKSDKWYFLPFVIALVISTIFKFIAALDPLSDFTSGFMKVMLAVFEIASISIDLLLLVYLTSKMMKLPNQANSRLRWFRYVLISLIGITAIWIYVTFADLYYGDQYWYAVYIGMSVMIYWMGHIGIYHFGAANGARKKSDNGKSALTEQHIEMFKKLLVVERRFLDPNLTLDLAASELHLSKSYLSRLINSEIGMSFPDYLNSLRVEEAKKYLCSGDYANYTLVAIGLEAGFNSKTTFNHVFKKSTSLTPSEFRKAQMELS